MTPPLQRQPVYKDCTLSYEKSIRTSLLIIYTSIKSMAVLFQE